MYNIEIKDLRFCENEIDHLLGKACNATVFHTFDWLSVLEDTLSLKCKIALFYSNDVLAGLCPFYPKGLSVANIFLSPMLSSETAYGGIITDDCNHIPDMVESLKDYLRLFYIVQPPTSESFSFDNINATYKQTVFTPLDAQNSTKHFLRIKKGHRYNIRKTKKDDNLEVVEDYSNDSIKSYYGLIKLTYGYNGLTPLPYKFYKSVIKTFHKKNDIKFLQVFDGNTSIAGAVALRFNDMMYYWTGAYNRETRTGIYPNDLLQWELIEWGYKENIKMYDMLGANIETIRKFKLGWGGDLVSYPVIYSSNALKQIAKIYVCFGKRSSNLIRNLIS